MACIPRRFSRIVSQLLGAAFLITFALLLYSHNSWKRQDYNEPHLPHSIKELGPPKQHVTPVNSVTDSVINAEPLPAYDRTSWPSANYDVHVFYYAWYGNIAHDQQWHHWNHRYLSHWDREKDLRYPKGRHEPPKDVGANFYPQLGAYSSKDPEVIDRHMYEIRKARIGVVAVSWYPKGQTDDEGEPPDRLIPALLRAADKYNLKVCFHIEPFDHRTAETVKAAIKYIIDSYGQHNAFYKKRKGDRHLPLFYIYDSYQVKESEWRKLFSRLETLTVRDTEYDAFFIGLAVEHAHLEQLYNAGFDGMYTYFASDTFVYGSTPSNWNTISRFCKTREMMFIPSVGPGYIDTEVRPWNGQNTKDRNNGKYYRTNFKLALISLPDIVSITSFNEWHEGTQIEAAIPHKRGYGQVYLDYGGTSKADMYMNLTRSLIESMPSTKRYH